MKKTLFLISIIIGIFNLSNAQNIQVVAAENQYGDVAKLIGKDNVKVTSIINNADGDPHSFISSVKNAKLLSNADVIIYNGADYDSWMDAVAKNNTKDITIKVEDLGKYSEVEKLGINPHLWYKPSTLPTLAKKLTETFSKLDGEHKKEYEKNYKDFMKRYAKVYTLIKDIKSKYKGTPVTATEPLFGYMSDALGLDMKALNFQWVIMNESEPSPKMMIDYQNLLKNKQVKVLFYNKQVTDNVTKNILKIANDNNIPVVGITETMPQNDNVISWMIRNLENTQSALNKSAATSNNEKTK